MKRLTPVEEQIMLKLWSIGKGSIKEIVSQYDNKKKPAYNTISTITRILERKKFVKHKTVGRGFIYEPKVTSEQYRTFLLKHLVDNYYKGDKKAVKKDLA